jgi:predicted ester cyclase
MSPDELKLHARRFPEEVLTQGDLAVAADLVAPGCTHHSPHAESTGVDGLKAWIVALRRAFPDLRAIVEDEIAEGDVVVQRLTLSGTHDGPIFGVPPTRRPATWQVIEVLRVGPDGKVTDRWSSWDRLGLLRQLGVKPLPEERS